MLRNTKELSMDNTRLTLDYYDKNADAYVKSTQHADMGVSLTKFLSYIPKGGKILDLGCGSGRDSKTFKDAGFKVVAVDGSKELCKQASEFIGQNVICSTFQEYIPSEQFDGIWANASLLHLNEKDMKSVITKLSLYLKISGCWFIAIKCEDFEGFRDNRFYKSMTKETFIAFMKQFKDLQIDKITITVDKLGRGNSWINAFVLKKAR